MRIILASASPRRQQMLRDLGLEFETRSPEIDEKRLRGEPAQLYAQRLARRKAEAVVTHFGAAAGSEWAVLAADTIVVLGHQIMGKPRDAEEAVRMLRKLSGRTHEVITAFCWIGSRAGAARSAGGSARTKVTFAEMPAEFWGWYVATGEPMDKAGAYAAQGIGMSFIERVSGSYSNVVGLPLSQVLRVFAKTFGSNLHGNRAASV